MSLTSNLSPLSFPTASARRPELSARFAKHMLATHDLYRDLMANGVPAEDARFVLPNAASTKLVMTMNARELHHFFELRCCRRSQWEIRAMAREMLRLARQAAPLLFAAGRSRLPERALPGRGHDLWRDQGCSR